MKATVENLKINRDAIINELTETFGTEHLKSKMRSLLNIVEEAEMFKTHDTINDCINHLCDLSSTSRRKTSNIAEMQGAWMERNGYTSFNHLTKSFQ